MVTARVPSAPPAPWSVYGVLHDVTGGQWCEPIVDADGGVVAVARVSPRMSPECRAALLVVVEAASRAFRAEVAAMPESLCRQEMSRLRASARLGRRRGGGEMS